MSRMRVVLGIASITLWALAALLLAAVVDAALPLAVLVFTLSGAVTSTLAHVQMLVGGEPHRHARRQSAEACEISRTAFQLGRKIGQHDRDQVAQ